MEKETSKKEQIPLELKSKLVRRINDYVAESKPKFSSRNHFFEILVTEYLDKALKKGDGNGQDTSG